MLEALEWFDFDALLKKGFEAEVSDIQIARKHGVDANWIQEQRRRLGFPAHVGHPSEAELVEVFKKAGRNCSEAARRLGMDRATFARR